MDDLEKLNEASLTEKEVFYSHLNMKDITDADYSHAKTACKDFEIKKLGEYHHFSVESNKLLLADLRTFKVCLLKYMTLILQNFFQLLD